MDADITKIVAPMRGDGWSRRVVERRRAISARLTCYLISASAETRGHLTPGNAKFYVEQLRELLQTALHRGM
jgi:hypothetical protein